MKRRRIVDAVSHIADNRTGVLQREYDCLLLPGIHLRKELGLTDPRL